MTTRPRRRSACARAASVISFLLLVLLARPAGAQPAEPPSRLSGWDQQLLRTVYNSESRVFRFYVEGTGRLFYPVFVGAAPVAWAGVGLIRDDGDWTDAYRLTVTNVGAAASALLLKRLFRRPRPFTVLPDIARRTTDVDAAAVASIAPESFPSGHATVSFALVTSWSLSHPQWYVIAPGAAWAVGVSLDRLWRGMHYPSDVIAGAVLGSSIALGVHLLRTQITPAALQPDRPHAAPHLVHLVLPL